MEIIEIKDLLNGDFAIDSSISVHGWIKSTRDSGKIAFIELNDGSTIQNIQIVCKKDSTKGFSDVIKLARTGTSIVATGEFKNNLKDDQNCEIIASEIKILKQSDEDYPLQKKQHSFEFLREIAHLRGRTTTIAAIMNVRSKLAFAIHKFFNQNGFIWVAAPIITCNDAEGAGENFVISQNEEKPFFDKTPSLTVSGQLNAEAYAQAFKKVYTFGPTFRAERSHTNRHLSEFWMVEPEIAFINLEQLQVVIEEFIKYITKYVADNCKDEIDFFAKEKPFIKERINAIINNKFKRVDYKDGIELLKKAISDGHNFEDKDVFFGKDLGSEHERYLCEKVYNSPIFLQNYPKDIKAFYMKVNKDGITVAANDLLVPGVGEIVGGSQREDDYDKLIKRCQELKMDISSIQWYIDLRKYGYHSSAGFGLGFERMIMYILDLENIREAIPFPRAEGSLKF
ncbi:MAG: asparagine--tRNA ligase [Mycoplasmataceae bacterium]|nr:asparagine--tRNA ligase [Mycoplasmataceae bacterium]